MVKKNIYYLVIIQALQYIVPLLTFPYLTRVLLPEGFGTLAFCLGIVSYLGLISQYSFSLTATSKLAQMRSKSNTTEISNYYWTITISKFILLSLGSLVLMLVVTNIDKLYELRFILLGCYLTVVGNTLLPNWFFQGIEKMKELAIIILIGRLMTIPLVFYLVLDVDDIWLAATIQGSGLVISGAFSIIYLIRKGLINNFYFNFKAIKTELMEGTSVFIATVGVNLYTASIPVFIGFFVGNVYVGYYNVADSIKRIALTLFNPIYQSIYPRINYLIKSDINQAALLIRKYFFISVSLALFMAINLNLFSEQIIAIVAGAGYEPSIIILRIMAILIVISVVNNFLGVQTLIPVGLKNKFSRIVLVSALFSMAYIFVLVSNYNAIGASVAVVITEFIIMCSLFSLHRKKGISIIKAKMIYFP
jgi:O-antigen/teichoic acid export membrane protein